MEEKKEKWGKKKFKLGLPCKQPEFYSSFQKCRCDKGPNDVSPVHLLEIEVTVLSDKCQWILKEEIYDVKKRVEMIFPPFFPQM